MTNTPRQANEFRGLGLQAPWIGSLPWGQLVRGARVRTETTQGQIHRTHCAREKNLGEGFTVDLLFMNVILIPFQKRAAVCLSIASWD